MGLFMRRCAGAQVRRWYTKFFIILSHTSSGEQRVGLFMRRCAGAQVRRWYTKFFIILSHTSSGEQRVGLFIRRCAGGILSSSLSYRTHQAGSSVRGCLCAGAQVCRCAGAEKRRCLRGCCRKQLSRLHPLPPALIFIGMCKCFFFFIS